MRGISSHEIEGILSPIVLAIPHAKSLDSDGKPIHRMSIPWKCLRKGSEIARNVCSLGKVLLESRGLFWRGQLSYVRRETTFSGSISASSAIG